MVIFLTPTDLLLKRTLFIWRINRSYINRINHYWWFTSNWQVAFSATIGFWPKCVSHSTPAVQFSRCAAPAKLPTWNFLNSLFADLKSRLETYYVNIIFALLTGEWNNIEGSGISRTITLPPILRPKRYYTYQTRVKLNRVFFPRFATQARSLGCSFAK